MRVRYRTNRASYGVLSTVLVFSTHRGVVFSEPGALPSSPHTGYELTHVRPSPGDCAAGWESSEALEVGRAAGSGAHSRGAWSCMDAAPGCRLHAEALLRSQHVDCVTRAGSPGTESRPHARSLVLHTPCWHPCRREPHVRGSARLGLDDEANSQIADGEVTRAAQVPVSPPSAVCQLPASARTAVQLILEKACSGPTPPGIPPFLRPYTPGDIRNFAMARVLPPRASGGFPSFLPSFLIPSFKPPPRCVLRGRLK